MFYTKGEKFSHPFKARFTGMCGRKPACLNMIRENEIVQYRCGVLYCAECTERAQGYPGQIPPGFYPDPTGTQRYWDSLEWTGRTK
mgnify:FL=1